MTAAFHARLAGLLGLTSGEDLGEHLTELMIRSTGQGFRTPTDEIVWADKQRTFTR